MRVLDWVLGPAVAGQVLVQVADRVGVVAEGLAGVGGLAALLELQD